MLIRRINERISEGKLNFAEIMGMSNMCHDTSVERIEYLINLYNESPNSLEKYETCFLVNYVASGRVDSVKDKGYALYKNVSGKKMILSIEDIKNGNYNIVENKDLRIMNKSEKDEMVNRIINDLKNKGFKFLETEKYVLAFNNEKNIVFYSDSVNELLNYYGTDKMGFFQQPRITYDNETVVSFYTDSERCNKEKTNFPAFGEGCHYLILYNRAIDKDTPFNSSMKRIGEYPELYNAVGEENQRLIDSIALSEEEKPKELIRK